MMVTWVNIIWFYRQSYLLDVSSGIFQMMVTDGYGAKIFIASQKDDLANQRAMPCLTMSWNHAWKKGPTRPTRISFAPRSCRYEKQEPSSWYDLLCEKMAPTKKQLSIMRTQTSSSDISQVPRFHGLTSFCQLITPMAVWGGIPFLQTSPPHSWRTCPNIPIISLSYLHIISVRNHILNYKCQVW